MAAPRIMIRMLEWACWGPDRELTHEFRAVLLLCGVCWVDIIRVLAKLLSLRRDDGENDDIAIYTATTSPRACGCTELYIYYIDHVLLATLMCHLLPVYSHTMYSSVARR